MIIHFQNILLLKQFLTCNCCFGLFTKILKRSGTSFCCTFFCAIVLQKCSLSNTLSIGKVSMSHCFSFSRYQTKCVIEFLFRQLMMSWTLRLIFDHPVKLWLTGRKRRKDRKTKIWISRERKELLKWNKKHFSVFEGYHLVKKNRKMMK